MTQTVQQGFEMATMIEHPDRVAWYRSLIQEWTGQVPQTAVVDDIVVAWVEWYCSQAGVGHFSTQVWEDTVEEALASLANTVYAQLQYDLEQLHAVAAQWAIAVLP